MSAARPTAPAAASRAAAAPATVRVRIERVVVGTPAGEGAARISTALPGAVEACLAGERLPPGVAHAVAAEVAAAVERAAREAAP